MHDTVTELLEENSRLRLEVRVLRDLVRDIASRPTSHASEALERECALLRDMAYGMSVALRVGDDARGLSVPTALEAAP